VEEKRSLPEILGPILGLFLLFGAIYGVVRYYQAGVAAAQAAQRTAQRTVQMAQPAPTNAAAAPTPTMTTAGGSEAAATDERPAPATAGQAPAPADSATVPVAEPTTDEASETLSNSSAVTDHMTVTAGVESEIVTPSTTPVGPASEIQPVADDVITGTETAVAATLSAAHEPSPLAVATVAKAGCGGCHTIPGVPAAVGQLGPDLANIGATAATRKPAFSAEAYIRESILEPNAFIAPDCPLGPCLANIMPANFAQTLSNDEVIVLVAYLTNLQDDR
jgi:hypothetical protein